MDLIYVGSHQEWRKSKTKKGSRRTKYVVVTIHQFVTKEELEQD